MRQISPRILPVLMPILLVGCTVGPDYQAPQAPTAGRFTESALPASTATAATQAGGAQTFVAGQDVAGQWWTSFKSPQINALVETALAANPDLVAAQATLREALDNQQAEQGLLFPKLTANASADRQQSSLATQGFGKGSKTLSVYTGSLGVSYTLDAFGGIRRQIEQLGAQTDYARYELEASYLALSANVVSTAIKMASLQDQIATSETILAAYNQALDLTQKRFALGGVSRVDVLQQQALRDAQAATLPGLRKQLEQTRNQLAIYLGHLPVDANLPSLRLADLTLPPEVPVSLPSKLVEQRPDIQAYAALVHSASADVGIATANLLPQISLTGSYGRTGTNFDNIFTPSGIIWSLASSIAQPIFDGGTLRARQRAAKEALTVAAAQYSSTVNTAFQNVADSLVAVQRDAETLQASQQSEQTAAASLAVAQAQYREGGSTYLNVLTAEQSEQSARLNLVAAQAARFTDTVALFQALGGGWWNRSDIEQTASCCGVTP